MKTITVEQVVNETIRILGDIRVPVALMNEIVAPVQQAISNLNACMDAWARDAAAQADQEEPEITIEPVEEGSEQDAD